jgi:hypothetical protein
MYKHNSKKKVMNNYISISMTPKPSIMIMHYNYIEYIVFSMDNLPCVGFQLRIMPLSVWYSLTVFAHRVANSQISMNWI